jgi:hypothetical protein
VATALNLVSIHTDVNPQLIVAHGFTPLHLVVVSGRAVPVRCDGMTFDGMDNFGTEFFSLKGQNFYVMDILCMQIIFSLKG